MIGQPCGMPAGLQSDHSVPSLPLPVVVHNLTRYSSRFKPSGTPHNVQRTRFHLIINPSEIFSDNSQRDQLNPTQEEHHHQCRSLPFEWFGISEGTKVDD